jgi:hypothetical protein
MKKNDVILKWLLIMLPGFLAQGVLLYFFQPKNETYLTGFPILILLLIGNMVVYHLLLVPKRIKKELSDLLFDVKAQDDFGRTMDLLTETIEEMKIKQAIYDGYQKAELQALLSKTIRNEKQFNLLSMIGRCSFYLSLVIGTLMYLKLTSFQREMIFLLWGLVIILVIVIYYFDKRRRESQLNALILNRCIEKCGDNDVFQFDNDI